MMIVDTTPAPGRATAERSNARPGRFRMPDVLRRLGFRRERVAQTASDHDVLVRVQRQTHANTTRLLERCLGAALAAQPAQQAAADAPVGTLPQAGAPWGYRFFPRDEDVEQFLRQHSRWSILALACHVEAATQSRAALEWMRENARLDAAARNAAVNDLILLFQGIDMLLSLQADWDVGCVAAASTPRPAQRDLESLHAAVLRAYRQRHIAAGMNRPQFARLLATLITVDQATRVRAELASVLR
jgi:hypothetical protein